MQVYVNYILFFLLLTIGLHGQTECEIKKPHYILHTDNPYVALDKYQNALNNYGKLDQFRFLNRRRTIKFQNSNVSVELYSAQELLNLYKKQISPFTIKEGMPFREMEFSFTLEGTSIKPQFK